MKIIHEYSIKVIIMILFFMIVLEGCFLSYIDSTSNKILKETYNETLKKTEQKTIEITRNTKKFVENLLMKYITELKLIARHIFLYKGKNNINNKNHINYNSKIFENKNNHKKIIEANLTKLLYTNDFFKIFKDTGQLQENGYPKNISTINLNYLNYYKQEFENSKDDNILLNKLLNEHNELNYIGHHYFGENESYNITKDKEKENLIKYILVILKSLYVSRLITKKQNLDIIRFLILNEEEIFIYPPEDYRKINLIEFRTVNPLSKCQYNNTDLSDYPYCIYDHLTNDSFPKASCKIQEDMSSNLQPKLCQKFLDLSASRYVHNFLKINQFSNFCRARKFFHRDLLSKMQCQRSAINFLNPQDIFPTQSLKQQNLLKNSAQ